MSLRMRLVLAFAVVVLAPLVSTGVLLARAVPAASDARVQTRLLADRDAVLSALVQDCARATAVATQLARAPELLTAPRAAARATVEGDQIAVVLNAAGRVLGSAKGSQATGDLTKAESQINGWDVLRARQNANRAYGAFTEFGNAPLADRAQAVIARANQRIRIAGITVIGVGLAILFGGFTVIALRHGRRQQLPALPPLE